MMTPHELAEHFSNALQRAETEQAVEPLAPFFGDDSTLINLGLQRPLRGKEAAKSFWQTYLDQFQEVRSEFSRKFVSEDQAVLEWMSKGKLADGSPIEYRGVSLLQIAGDQVSHFRTYYDSAAFLTDAVQS